MRSKLIPAVALSFIVTACSDSLGGAMGDAQVNMSSATAAPIMLQSTDGSQSQAVPADTVESFTVTITSIQFLRADAEETDAGGWTTLNFDEGIEVDLMALPEEGIGAMVIADGQASAGSYSMVRIFVSNPTIVFKGDITLGVAQFFEGGVEYAVTIPSGAQTGLKVAVDFSIEADSETEVNLLFDEGLTLTNLTVTGAGAIVVAPVLR